MFNFNNEDHEGCCPNCGCSCSQEPLDEGAHDYEYYQTEIDTPENILASGVEYFSTNGNINDKDDLKRALAGFFNEVYAYSKKEFLIDQVDAYMEALKQMDSVERNR